MKYLLAILTIAFLVSCSNEEVEQIVVVEETTMEVNEDINSEMENLEVETNEVETTQEENNVILIDANYTNPNGLVDMTVEYTLWDNEEITSIEVKATTYDVTDFNTEVQKLVGLTIEEAQNAEISGWSLTTEAFKEALK